MEQIKTKKKIFKKCFLNQKHIKQKKLLFKGGDNTYFLQTITS